MERVSVQKMVLDNRVVLGGWWMLKACLSKKEEEGRCALLFSILHRE